MMKTMVTQLSLMMRLGRTKSNVRLLIRFAGLLVVFFVLYSVLFHALMLHEGREYSWLTGFYWTLTTMSTLGFGDITFTSDAGRLFSVVVLNDDITSTNIIFTIREINTAVPTVTNADNEDSLDILQLAGSTHVLQFTQMLGKALARRVIGVRMEAKSSAVSTRS